ncbi:hypothetical protein BDV19DRAFT_385450 [Aspergillus venezuelensis]
MSAANAEPVGGALQQTATNKTPETNSSKPNVNTTKSHKKHTVTPKGFKKATHKDINVEYSKIRRRFMLTYKREKNGGVTEDERDVSALADQRMINALDRYSTAVSHTFMDAHPELLKSFKVFFDLLQKDGSFKPLVPGTETHAAFTAVMQSKSIEYR